jgi:hypothetical protein
MEKDGTVSELQRKIFLSFDYLSGSNVAVLGRRLPTSFFGDTNRSQGDNHDRRIQAHVIGVLKKRTGRITSAMLTR